MSDWEQSLTPDEADAWETFVRSVRSDAMRKIDESAFVLQLVPRGEPDIKFCVELGLAVMYDKPILAVIHPDGNPPGKLLQIADIVVKADIDTEEGRDAVAWALKTMRDPLGEEME